MEKQGLEVLQSLGFRGQAGQPFGENYAARSMSVRLFVSITPEVRAR
jgi:hypothetical protein